MKCRQLLHIHTLNAIMYLESGLHIGAGKDTVEIGGLDQPIIKNPLNGEPYVPGSSVKGKMRALLETGVFVRLNEATRDAVLAGRPCNCGQAGCPVCTLFGASSEAKECGPTRLLVRDACLVKEDADLFRSGQLPMEIKYENTINRVKGVAEHPRPLERVPAGVRFALTLTIREYEGDAGLDLMKWVFAGLRLLELDALGGCSSRGCGQVRFEDITLDGEKKCLPDNPFQAVS